MEEEKKKKLQKELERWESTTVKKVTDRFPLRKKYYRNLSDYDSKALYTPNDIKDLDYQKDLGFPGEYPFTRHVQPTAYRGRFWTMRMFAGLATSTETNERFKYLIKNGQTGLSVAFHLPTLYGYESCDPMSTGEVGKIGVAIDTV